MSGKSDAEREGVYRGMVAAFACAIYNGEAWDRKTVVSYLHMGDVSIDYGMPEEELPDQLTDELVWQALDRMFEKAGM